MKVDHCNITHHGTLWVNAMFKDDLPRSLISVRIELDTFHGMQDTASEWWLVAGSEASPIEHPVRGPYTETEVRVLLRLYS